MDELARCLSERLFTAFPEFAQYAKPTGEFIEIAIPQPGADRVLSLTAGHNTISMVFDEWEWCFSTFLGVDIEQLVGGAVELVSGLVTERQVVQIYNREGKRVWASLEYVEVLSTPTESGMLRTCSWKGTYDRTIEIR